MLPQPHILFIVLDTTRRDHLSHYGYPLPTTPHLSAFAAGATTFERAIASAQWTIPSHAGMFTGTYPSTHAVTQADSVLSGAHPTLAEILRGAGYHTVAFCNNPLVGMLNNGLQRGFQKFYNYASAAPFRPKDERQSAPRRAVMRNFRRYVARPIGNQFAKSDWMFRQALHPALVPIWTKWIHYKGDTAASVQDLQAYWQAHQAGQPQQPLFAFLNVMGAHLPYNPPRDVLERFARGLSPASYRFMRRFNAEAARWASPPDAPLEDWQTATLEHFYAAEIAHQDALVGQMLAQLQQSGALENTLVIVTADHGEGHGDHGFFGHGFVAYQELVQVPLFIRWPDGAGAGQRVAQNLSTRRLFQTCLAEAGIQQAPLDESDPNAQLEHLSLRRTLAAETLPAEPLVLAEAFPPEIFLGVIQHRNAPLVARLALDQVRRAVYSADDKLALWGDQVEGLFHLPSDPREQHNHAAQAPQRAAELQTAAHRLVAAAQAWRSAAPSYALNESAVLEHLRALGYVE